MSTDTLESTHTFELVEIEGNWDDEPKCQAFHENDGIPPCSKVVTHIGTTCGAPPLLICQNTAEYCLWAISGGMGLCNMCMRPVVTDWWVRPI